MVNDIDIHIAKKKLKLHNSSSIMSSLSTMWKGEVVCLTVCTLNYEIQNIFCLQSLDPDDVDVLNEIVNQFFNCDT
jgi:hypothetical protein